MFPSRATSRPGKEGDPDGKDFNRRMLENGALQGSGAGSHHPAGPGSGIAPLEWDCL